jgi:hypothetical protein
MSNEIITEVFTKCGITSETVKNIAETQKNAFYKMIKTKLQMYKKNKESGIRDYYNEIKNNELKDLQKECDKSEAMVLSLLNKTVSKPKKTISDELQQIVWHQKNGDNKDDLCNICKKTSITKSDFKIARIIPESRGGNNDHKNLIPVCDSCYKKYNDSKSYLLHYINTKYPEIDYNKLFTELVAKYYIFHYVNESIVFVNEVCHMEQNMIICETQLNIMNNNLNNLMDIDIMKPSGVIIDEGNLNMIDYTGNMVEKCYFVDILLLFHYIKLLIKTKQKINFTPKINSNFNNVFNKFNTLFDSSYNTMSNSGFKITNHFMDSL